MKVLITLTLALLTACAVFDVHKPVTYEDNVAFIQSSTAEAQSALLARINGRSISKKDATNVDNALDNVVEGLQVAIDLRAAGDPDADAKLEAVRASLIVVCKYLRVQSCRA